MTITAGLTLLNTKISIAETKELIAALADKDFLGTLTVEIHCHGSDSGDELCDVADLQSLAADHDRLEKERQDIVIQLREICAEFGNNDWSDDLHLGDVIEKHLAKYLWHQDASVDVHIMRAIEDAEK